MGRVSIGDLDQYDRFLFEERAAIMEYEGGMSRAEAETEALKYVGGLRAIKGAV